MTNEAVVQLLECDPDLGEGLTRGEWQTASKALPAQTTKLAKGHWHPSTDLPETGHLGYLILDGLLARRLKIGDGSSVELLSRGDLLRPWQEEASSFCATSWEVLDELSVLTLGPRLGKALMQWPAIVSNLLARAMRRSRVIAADAAIESIVGVEERVLLMLWLIAENWGTVDADGIRITIRLPHRLLAELVGARRPSVTSALSELQQQGRLAIGSDGYWVLRGDPPA